MFIQQILGRGGDPMLFVAWLIAILFSLTIHEFAHAFAANQQGDPTAKLLGRLSFNPLVHIDTMGFLALLFVGFGWGKPVPVNPIYFKNKKRGDIIVSLAGPAANLIALFLFGIVLKLAWTFGNFSPDNLMIHFLYLLMMVNLVLCVFNLIPIPPLDGSHVLLNLLPSSMNEFKYSFVKNGTFILIALILMDNLLGLHLLGRFLNFIWYYIISSFF